MPKRIYQFKVTLTGITPTIWRCILVPENYSFWDLHVAIQDAMGWLGGKYDPQSFSPGKVKFDNPAKRWKAAFS